MKVYLNKNPCDKVLPKFNGFSNWIFSSRRTIDSKYKGIMFISFKDQSNYEPYWPQRKHPLKTILELNKQNHGLDKGDVR